MEKYYTRNYKLITEVNGIGVVLASYDRWLCYFYIEKNGNNLFVTLYDNFCERYTFKIENVILCTDSKNAVYKNNEIEFTPKDQLLFQQPNFAIDVMQTFVNPVAFETLRRQAEILFNNYR